MQKASSLFYIATRLYPWNKCSRHLTFKSPIRLFLMISDPFCSQSDGLFELNRYVIVSEALTSRNFSWWFEINLPTFSPNAVQIVAHRESSTPTDIIFIFFQSHFICFYHSSVALFCMGSLLPLFYSVYM